MKRKKQNKITTKCRLKKGDQVILLAGRDRNGIGEVESIVGERVLVKGLNKVHKCVRRNPEANEEGGIIQKEAPIHVSNVAIYNPNTKKADRVGFSFLEDGKKVRIYKSDQTHIDG